MVKYIVIILGYVLILLVGKIFVDFICRYLNFPYAKDTGIKRAGMIIGFLERFIILTFVLLNEYSAIAFIFTAKSIARFEELKDRDFAEYYLVGTLSSVSFAILCGEIMKFITDLVGFSL